MASKQEHNIARRCIEGLMQYAAERQVGFERHQKSEYPFLRMPEYRNQQIRKLIGDIANTYKLTDDPESLLVAFNERLAAAKRSFAVELTPFAMQRDAVQGLLHYVCARSACADDARLLLMDAKELLEDITVYLPWDAQKAGVYPASDHVELELRRQTAARNIVFTRILMGGERGPGAEDYVGGVVKTEDGVRSTKLFSDLHEQYPEIENWPAMCIVYRGNYCRGIPEPASELDLTIMRGMGEKFLDMKGVEYCGGLREFSLSVSEQPQQMTL